MRLIPIALLGVLTTWASATAQLPPPVQQPTAAQAPIKPALQPGNAQPIEPACLEAIGVRRLLHQHPELTGAAATVGLVELCQPARHDSPGYSFMPNLQHDCFDGIDREGSYHYDNPHRPVRYSQHATVIAALLFGYDEQASCDGLGHFFYRGIVPAAAMEVYEANWFLYRRVMAVGPTIPSDVLTVSWGTDAQDELTMYWQRGIDALAARDRCVIVAGCGNGGTDNTIAKPSWGYNVISVGTARGLGQFPHSFQYVGRPIFEHSSFGPTEDGRSKPDVIALGLAVEPTVDSPHSYQFNRQGVGYSSFAAPQVAGIAALLIDAARFNQIDQGDDPLVIKALILNGANKLVGWHKGTTDPDDDHESPLDYRQGAGLVDAAASYRQLTAGQYNPASPSPTGWDAAAVALTPNDPNSQRIYHLGNANPGTQVKATLTWNRHYQQNGLFAALPLNSISLELWTVAANGELLHRLDHSDSTRDTVQHLYFENHTQGPLAIVVRSLENRPPHTPYEDYGLAYTVAQKNWTGDQFAADLNLDGIVDAQDIVIWVAAWTDWQQRNTTGETDHNDLSVPEDLNCDGRIDQTDFNILTQQRNRKAPWHTPNANSP